MISYDCHAHVYEHVAAIEGARYVPKSPAPLEKWLDHQRMNGLIGGVIVQVSFLGTDNSELLSALARLDKSRFAGVGVVPFDIDAEELESLVVQGIRGVRWNLVRGAAIPDLASKPVADFLAKLRAWDLHLEIHLEGPRLAGFLDPLTDQGLKIVIDHFGLPSEVDPRQDPMIAAVKARRRDNLYMKFSAHYRTPFDLRPHAQELLSALSADRVVWGSDWPHTQHETGADFSGCVEFGQSLFVSNDDGAVGSLYGLNKHESI
ncbi:MAG: amidohydrolase [Paracoccaceae bacterium]